MKIENFDSNILKELRKEINEALNLIGEKHNISLNIGNMTYTSSSFTSKLTCEINDAENLDDKAKSNLSVFGLSDSFNKIIIFRNIEYKIINANNSKRKYPIECIRLNDNTKIMFTLELVKSLVK